VISLLDQPSDVSSGPAKESSDGGAFA
jgi:hypothetical protein